MSFRYKISEIGDFYLCDPIEIEKKRYRYTDTPRLLHTLICTNTFQRQHRLQEFKDTKWVISIRISKNRQHNDQNKTKNKKGQTTIYKTYT